MLSSELKATSWLLALRGIVGILLGLFLATNPQKAALLFALVFGFYVIFDGLVAIFSSFSSRKAGVKNWWLEIIEGVLKIILGLVILFWPVASTVTLVLFIQIVFAIWAIIAGISMIAGAFSLSRGFVGMLLWLIGGIFLTLIGVVLVIRPVSVAEDFLIAIGIFNVVIGVIYLIGALSLRTDAHNLEKAA